MIFIDGDGSNDEDNGNDDGTVSTNNGGNSSIAQQIGVLCIAPHAPTQIMDYLHIDASTKCTFPTENIYSINHTYIHTHIKPNECQENVFTESPAAVGAQLEKREKEWTKHTLQQ